MKNPGRSFQTLILAASAACIVVAFQNCSPVNFKEDTPAVFRLQSTELSSPVDGSSDIADIPMNSEAPTYSDSTPSKKELDNSGSDHAADRPTGGKKVPETNDSSVNSAALVECELIAPNKKIVLDSSLKVGSNASETRTCMSEYACLRLINAYSAKRNCELTVGASELSDSEAQCTKIFPGSKGTCKKAGLLDDSQVEAILAQMGK